MVSTPSCWWELGKIPDVDNVQELAQKIQASFELPQWMSKIYDIENYYLAPPAPNCLHQKDFLSLLDPRFPCQDIQEEQVKKTIAYAQVLQYWAERANPPMPGQPHLLVRSVLELHETMEGYVSFSNDVVLGSVVLMEGFFGNCTQLTISRDALPTSTDVPSEEDALEKTAPLGGPQRTNHTPGTT